jgi:hypothetical protein
MDGWIKMERQRDGGMEMEMRDWIRIRGIFDVQGISGGLQQVSGGF